MNTLPPPAPTMRERLARWIPRLAGAVVLLWLVVALIPTGNTGPYDLATFGKLPVSYGGRFKPLDSVARNSLLILNNRQGFDFTYTTDASGKVVKPGEEKAGDKPTGLTRHTIRVSAISWLLDVLARPEQAHTYKIFRVDNLQVQHLFRAPENEATEANRFSYATIASHLDEINRQTALASRVEEENRSAFQIKLLELAQHLNLYTELVNHTALHTIPPPETPPAKAASAARPPTPQKWLTLASVLQSRTPNDTAEQYRRTLLAVHNGDPKTFNRAVAQLHAGLAADFPAHAWYSRVEAQFNRYAPFYKAMLLYVVVGLMVLVTWLAPDAKTGWGRTLLRSANTILVLTLVLHTAGIAMRIYLSGRPPVTNLYSSAIFIGWGVVVFALGLERLFGNGMGTIAAAATGAVTLLIAQSLAADGDTMAVLQAVLDTNFWLATHVVVITLGYSATYLAGLLGILYILRGVFTKSLSPEESKRLTQMIYGIVCFAVLFSFVGTVLGGIWADQSWGRFWGWDPKENGAILIVIWNAIILHARWGGLVKGRGMANLAIFGNVVTSWSWFGVNMLGAGLHSYGFMNGATTWLLVFVSSQILLIGVGTLPVEAWRSFAGVDPKKFKAMRRRATDPTPPHPRGVDPRPGWS